MKKNLLFVSALFMSAILVGGCSNADRTKEQERVSEHAITDLQTTKEEIRQVYLRFSDLFAKADSVGIADLYTKDGKFMAAGGPSVVGREGIQKVMSGMIGSGVTRVEFNTGEVHGCEDFVVEEGVVSLFVNDQKVGEEKYLVLWKREDGQWKLFKDIFNSNLPAPAGQ